MGLFDKDRTIHDLVRREAVIHLVDGETSMRGFLVDFYPHAILVAKAQLLIADQQPAELAGEALVFRDQIKFVQLI